MIYLKQDVMAKKKLHRAKVIEAFKRNKGGVLREYKVGDTYITNHFESIEYLIKIKKVK